MGDDLHKWAPFLLTAEQIGEIKRRWPEIEAYQVDRIAEGQKFDRDHRGRPPGEMRQYLGEIQSRITPLLRIVSAPAEDLWFEFHKGERSARLPGATKRARTALEELETIISAASDLLLVGAPPFKVYQTLAFRDVRDLVTEAGYKVNRSPNGPLVTILEMVLKAIGEKADAYSVVDYQLKVEKRISKS